MTAPVEPTLEPTLEPQPRKTIATKMRENLAALRAQGAPREVIRAEIDRARQAFSRASAEERKLTGLETVAGLGSKAAAGATFGLFDEIAPLLGGDTDTQRFLQKQVAEEHPVAAFGAEVLGGFAVPGTIVKQAPRTASFLSKTARVLGEGAAQGAASAFGSAEGGFTERAKQAVQGATVGAAAAGAFSGLARGAGAVRRSVREMYGGKALPEQERLARIADAFGDEDIESAFRNLARKELRGLGPETMVADVLPQGEGMLRQQVVAGGREARRVVDKELRERSNRLANLADERLSERTGTMRQSARKSVEELSAEASARAEPFYKQAREEAAAAPKVERLSAAQRKEMEAMGISADQMLARARTVSVRDEAGRLRRNLANVSDNELQQEYARLAELNSAEEALHAGIEESAYRSDYEDLPRTERLGKKGQEDLPDADSAMDPDILAGHNKIVSNYNRAIIVRRARDAAMERINTELGQRAGATDFDFGANVGATAPLKSDAIDEALSLPYVQQRIEQLRSAPRSKFAKVADDDYDLLHNVYTDIGRQIRSLDRKDWSLKQDLIQQRAILAEAIESRSPSYAKARGEFADPMGRREAYEMGAKRQPADVIGSEMADLSPAEQAVYREAKVQTMRGTVPTAELGEFARFSDVLAPIANREKADVFKATFGEPAFKEYLRDVLEMASLQRMRAGAGESTTVDKLVEQAVADPDRLAGIVQSLASGNPLRAVTQLGRFGQLAERLRRSKSAKENVAALTERGSANVRERLDQLARLRREGRAPERSGARFTRRPERAIGVGIEGRPEIAQVGARVAGGYVGRP